MRETWNRGTVLLVACFVTCVVLLVFAIRRTYGNVVRDNAEAARSNVTLVSKSRIEERSLRVIHDGSKNVTCWVWNGESISCLPDSEVAK